MGRRFPGGLEYSLFAWRITMPSSVLLPPDEPATPEGIKSGGWWHESGDGRLTCDLCPRSCALRPGDRGFCFVRQNREGRIVSTTYGRSTGFCIDPIEKKPLDQFYPGTAVLSFGTAGCNLGCKFCQNWSISKSREVDAWCDAAEPETIARAARRLDCRSVAFTYNDPIVWAEYAIDTARACRREGVKTVAVTSGYIGPAAREAFFEQMDAANVDLKGFSEQFYWKLSSGHLEPVLDTLRWLVHRSQVWVEITTLLIPGANDSPAEVDAMCRWILNELGPDVPLHLTAFHPDFRMTDRGPTPPATLAAAHDIARRVGLRYVYTGNVSDRRRQSTCCPHCGIVVIGRDGYDLDVYRLQGDRCAGCGGPIAGRFDAKPGRWGSRRQPVRIAGFA
jgi:pyruvate formate lyase activating enzyme